jgi:hypothetical protein
MGRGRGGIVSDPQKPGPKPEPDEDLLDFLGGIDELNEDSQDGDFSDFLARTDLEKIPAGGSKPAAPEGKKHE